MELERKAIEDQIERLKELHKSLDNIDGGFSIMWQAGMNLNSWEFEDHIMADVVKLLVKNEIYGKILLRTKELIELEHE